MVGRVLIVGAGIAGHSMAIAMSRAGIAYDIIEKKEDFEILGSGMYVQNNALRCFDRIGVADRILARGWISPTGESRFLDEKGNHIATTRVPPCPGSDFPGYVPISRGQLHDILHRALEDCGTRIRMGTCVNTLSDRGDFVDVTFTDGTKGQYDLVVGADGINSATREFLFPGAAPEYSGFSNWRLTLDAVEPMDAVYWQMGDERSFGIIPISDNSYYAAGVSKEPGDPHFEKDELLGLFRDRFSGFEGPARRAIDAVTGNDELIYTPVREIHLATPWYRGNVVLVGDAAHASTPFWAQGASMAVEDVILLAELLTGGGSTDTILAEWQERRASRCTFVQEGSRRTGELGHTADPAARAKGREHLRAHAQDDVDRRYQFLNQPI